ncbi:hypothetical protein [Chelativorans sp.]|uniref:hypothetical protein n=1 Tax=Chelativorans sp. TaxID=2203393 RepID=UPI0028113C87|nr:hypothetical protein [Chelativorans sp.]
MKKKPVLSAAAAVALAIFLAGCGAASAVRTTGEGFDRAECLAREFKGEPPCEAED